MITTILIIAAIAAGIILLIVGWVFLNVWKFEVAWNHGYCPDCGARWEVLGDRCAWVCPECGKSIFM